MIWQHTETSSKMENLPHHIFEKRPSIQKPIQHQQELSLNVDYNKKDKIVS